MIGLAGIVVASGLWTTPAEAQESPGADLIRKYGNLIEGLSGNLSQVNNFPAGQCSGLVRGVWVTSQWHSTSHDIPTYLKVCSPDEANVGQMVRVVHKWLEDNPGRLHEDEVVLVSAAILDAFPCSP